MMNHAFPDVVVTEEDLIADENTAVERSSAAATHAGDFMGTAPTGRRIHWTEIHIYRLADGKVAGHWVELSMLRLLQQIGANPLPVAARELGRQNLRRPECFHDEIGSRNPASTAR